LSTDGGAEDGLQLNGWRDAGPQSFDDFAPFSRASNRLARNSPLRPSEANLIKVEVGMARADVMKDSRNRSSNAIVESFR
jgi:hypothetical protein